MSAPASSHAKNNTSVVSEYPSIELVRLVPRWKDGLKLFLQDLSKDRDEIFFSPHPRDENSINRIVGNNGRDLYYVMVEDEKILGYGLLRGWDEGYQIPSLGVAIHPSVRGTGLGKILITFLHIVAFRRGACKVRLRVHRDNEKAIDLYKSFGYVFEDDVNQAEYFLGFKSLGRE